MDRRKIKHAPGGGLGVVTEVLDLFTSGFSRAEEQAILLDAIFKQPYLQSCGVLLSARLPGRLTVLATRGVGKRFAGKLLGGRNAGILARAADAGLPVIRHATADPHFAYEKPYGSLILVPLRAEERVLGVLFALTVPKHQAQAGELEVLKTLAALVAISFTRAGLARKTRELEIIDDLTMLYNAGHFNKRFDIEFSRAAGRRAPLSLMIINIDNFEDFCLVRGGSRGEALLIEMATIVRNHLRTVDIIGRYSLNQIIATLYDCTARNAAKVAHRVSDRIQRRVLAGCQPHLGLSIGIAGMPSAAVRTAADLRDGAEEAVYHAFCGEGTNIRIFK
jgi:diguanylate cyclase (GGDEF)-like protein